MRRACAILAVVLAAGVAGGLSRAAPATASGAKAAVPEERFNVDIDSGSASDFLELLSRRIGVLLAPAEALDSGKVTLHLRNATVGEAFAAWCPRGHSVRRSEDGGYCVGCPPGAPEPGPEERDPLEVKVTIAVRGSPLADYLAELSARSGAQFVLADGVGTQRVTLSLRDVTVREALEALGPLKGLYCRRVGDGVYVIDRRSRSAARKRTKVYPLDNIRLVPSDP